MPTRDLSHPLDADTWTYPGDPPVTVESHATIGRDGYQVSALSLGTHAGTHLDAPSHTEPDGPTVDALPVERFAFEARRIGVDAGTREPIERADLPSDVAGADLFVFDTGWAARWGTDRYLDHPYLSADAAEWCADNGLAVAIDAPSVDPSRDVDVAQGRHPAHHALLGGGHVIVENLTALDGLPDRFELRAYPLPIAAGDGSPVRAIAAW